MGRIRTGWSLVKKSWSVVRTHPGMAKLPVVGSLLALLSLIVIGTPAALIVGDSAEPTSAQQITAGALALVALYVASFFVIFFNVALAAAADAAFKGEEVSFGSSVAVARTKLGVIAAWALVAGLVSLVFAILRDRGGIAGQIVAGLGAALWSLITFLVIPVLAFEDIGPIAAIKRSGGLFKQKWGEQITGNAAIGIITLFFILGAVALGAGGVFWYMTETTIGQVGGVSLMIGSFILVVVGVIASSVARGVFGVALYNYVTDAATVGPFSAGELESAVKQTNGKGRFA